MKFVPNKVSRLVSSQVLKTQQASPTLLFVGGVTGAVAATVLACRATLKLEAELKLTESTIEAVKEHESNTYSDQDRQKDLAVVYVQSSIRIVKLYSPALIVGGLSIAALTKSHSILNKRNAGLVAAYKVLEKGFDEYRERVIAEHGPEKDEEYLYGTVEREIVIPTKQGDKITTVKGPKLPSRYAKWFAYETSGEWKSTPEINDAFLKLNQAWLNDRLAMKGHLFLNEAYDQLGLDRTTEGAVVGWRYKDGGDGYVSFGCFDKYTGEVKDNRKGEAGSILLDFNVDGIIYDKI